MASQSKQLGIRVNEKLLDAIDQDMEKKNYTTYSEYVREAIREKLEAEKQWVWTLKLSYSLLSPTA